MIDQENDESFKGFILANKLKNEYEKNVRDVIGDEMKDSLKKNNNTQESDKVNIGDGKKKRKSKKEKVGDDTNSEVLNTEETKKKKKSKKKSKEKNDDEDNTLNTTESKKKKKSKKKSG